MRIPNRSYSGKKAKGQLLLARTTIPRTKGVRLHTTANANTNTLIYGFQAQSKKKKIAKVRSDIALLKPFFLETAFYFLCQFSTREPFLFSNSVTAACQSMENKWKR